MPAGPDGDSDLSVTLQHGEDSAQRVSGLEEAGGEKGWDVPSSWFLAVLESQPRSVQCCPLPQTLPITGKLIYNVAVLWGGEGCKAGFAMYPIFKKSFQLKHTLPS